MPDQPDPNLQLVLGQLLTTQQSMANDISGMRQDVAKALTRIEVIDSRNGDADNLHRDHEARIRSLERFKYLLLGGAGLAGGAGGWLAQYLASRH